MSNKKIWISFFISLLLIILSAGLFILSFLYTPHSSLKSAKQFVRQQLINSNGLLESYPYRASKIPGRADYKREALSESAGLWLWILGLAQERRTFEDSTAILKKYFLLPNGTLSWRIDIQDLNQTVPDPHNATVDDLRVIRVLLEKGKEWDRKEYVEIASNLAGALKKHALYQDFLIHQARLKKGDEEAPKIVILSYLDLKAMLLLSELDPDWKPIYEHSLALLIKGMRPNGFFYDRYDVEKNTYFDEEKNMINQLLCALYLAEVGVSANNMLVFLKEEWVKQDKIYGRYDPETGERRVDFENIAVYALVMRLAGVMKDFPFANAIKNRIRQLKAKQTEILWKNSLCDGPCHAFDHLQALVSFMMSEKT